MPRQIRAARSLLGWKATDLAKRAQLGVATVRRAEGGSVITAANAAAIRRALEDGGVEIGEDGSIRLKS
jgi:ribosome-binding protein aMBF1 (putative translation factor)